jgi:hypothetical protein
MRNVASLSVIFLKSSSAPDEGAIVVIKVEKIEVHYWLTGLRVEHLSLNTCRRGGMTTFTASGPGRMFSQPHRGVRPVGPRAACRCQSVRQAPRSRPSLSLDAEDSRMATGAEEGISAPSIGSSESSRTRPHNARARQRRKVEDESHSLDHFAGFQLKSVGGRCRRCSTGRGPSGRSRVS